MINLHLDIDILTLPEYEAKKKIDDTIFIAEHFCSIELFEECKYCSENALRMAEQINYIKGIAGSKYVLGMHYDKLNDFLKAIPLLEDSVKIYDSINDFKNAGIACKELGICCWKAGDYKSQIDNFFKALYHFRQIGDEKLESDILNCIGNYYLIVVEYPLALEYYSMALKLSRKFLNISVCIIILYNKACTYYNLREYSKALSHLYAAQDFNLKIEQNRYFEYRIMNTTASIHSLQGDYENAERIYLKCLNYFMKTNRNVDRCDTLVNLANNYSQMNKQELAEATYQQALELSFEINNKTMMVTSCRELSKFYVMAGNFKEALLYMRKFSILDFERNRTLQEDNVRKLNVLHKVDITKKETEVLSEKNEQLKSLNEKLIKLNNEKNYFLNLAANDLKIPLGRISGKINLIKKGGNEQRHAELTDILIESSHMQKIISELLTVNESQSAK